MRLPTTSQPSAVSRGTSTTNPTARASRAAAFAASTSSNCASNRPRTKRLLSSTRSGAAPSILPPVTSAASSAAGDDHRSRPRGQTSQRRTRRRRPGSRSLGRLRWLTFGLARTACGHAFGVVRRTRDRSVFGAWKVPRLLVALPIARRHGGSRGFCKRSGERPRDQSSPPCQAQTWRDSLSAAAEERAMCLTRVSRPSRTQATRCRVGSVLAESGDEPCRSDHLARPGHRARRSTGNGAPCSRAGRRESCRVRLRQRPTAGPRPPSIALFNQRFD